jgi:hypothetical protein
MLNPPWWEKALGVVIFVLMLIVCCIIAPFAWVKYEYERERK